MFFLLPPIDEKRLVCLLDSTFLPLLMQGPCQQREKVITRWYSAVRSFAFLLEVFARDSLPGLRRPNFGTVFRGRHAARVLFVAPRGKLPHIFNPVVTVNLFPRLARPPIAAREPRALPGFTLVNAARLARPGDRLDS